jgi:4-hydroxy-3-methylbut-2-en-1-yl diphosphate synthase IspG/GcpE
MRDLVPKFSILKDVLKEIAEKREEMVEAKLEHARAIKQIRDLNLKLSILNDVLKEMVEAGEKKEQDV